MQDEHWLEAQRKRIKEAFALFDKDKKGARALPLMGAINVSAIYSTTVWPRRDG